MKEIKNGFDERYCLTKDGLVIDRVSEKVKNYDGDNCIRLKLENGNVKKIAKKNLYKLVYGKPFCIDDVKDLDGEEWREVEDTNGEYFISNLGRLKSLKGYKAKVLSPTTTKSGYERSAIHINGYKRSIFIHRLVAQAFLPMPKSLDYHIHHIDFDKSNNKASNLKWLSIEDHIKIHEEKERNARKFM